MWFTRFHNRISVVNFQFNLYESNIRKEPDLRYLSASRYDLKTCGDSNFLLTLTENWYARMSVLLSTRTKASLPTTSRLIEHNWYARMSLLLSTRTKASLPTTSRLIEYNSIEHHFSFTCKSSHKPLILCDVRILKTLSTTFQPQNIMYVLF